MHANFQRNQSSSFWVYNPQTHAVNLRNHLTEEFVVQPGCLISTIEDTCYLSNRDDFWTKIRKFHHRFKNYIKITKAHWKTLRLSSLFDPASFIQPPRTFDYNLSNFGWCDHLVQEPNSGIKATRFVRQTILNDYPFPVILIGCHSLCNKFSIYCNFPSYRVNVKEGKLIFTTICKAIQNISSL